MHVRLYIFSPSLGVERQWIRHTDLKQARRRVKTGEGRITSSRQMLQIHSTRKQSCNVWSREQHFQLCRKTEPQPDWWVRVEHTDQLTGLGRSKQEQSGTRCATHQRRQVPMLKELSERATKLRNDPEPRDHGPKGYQWNVFAKVMPDRMRNCVWQITRRLARPGRMKHVERPCGRARNGQVSEFTKMNHFREPQKDGECSLRLWRDAVMVSSEHWRGTPARVQRLDRKPMTEMNGELWNTSPRQEEKLQIKDRECIALRQ